MKYFFDLFIQSGFQIQFSFSAFCVCSCCCCAVWWCTMIPSVWKLRCVCAQFKSIPRWKKKLFHKRTSTQNIFFCIFCRLHIVHSQKSTIKMGKQKKKLNSSFIYISVNIFIHFSQLVCCMKFFFFFSFLFLYTSLEFCSFRFFFSTTMRQKFVFKNRSMN